jgi:hypothetical protein
MAKELFATPSFRRSAVIDDPRAMLRAWLTLALHNPAKMIAAHAERVRLFLPPFVTAPHTERLPFIHSTILPNDFGLQWRFPRAAQMARLLARAWNAMALIVANASLWLVVLVLAAVKLVDARHSLRPAILMAISLEVGILAAAPMSEGRYGLFILICGQLAALVMLLEAVMGRRLTPGQRPGFTEAA